MLGTLQDQDNGEIAYPLLMSYVLGFDGGGTKTECVLMDSSDHVVTRTFAGPSNPSRIGVEPAVRAIEKAANLSLSEARLDRSVVVAVGAGIAGTANPEMRERTRAAVQSVFPEIAVKLLTDLEAALAAAGEGPVIVLVAGTGSAAIGRNLRNEIFRAGGYGPSSSDQGSAYDIGRKAIAAATKAGAEGATPSVLYEQILARIGCATWSEVRQRAETAPDEVFPPIFPVIAAAAQAGDTAAREILVTAAAELSSLAAEVADRLDLRDAVFLAKTGGMIRRSAFFDTQLDAALKRILPHAQIGGLKISPAEAAALAARG
jgi:N-acetylglucosamine kinase-like BadF-type ATPase